MEFLSIIQVLAEQKLKEHGIELGYLNIPSRVAQDVTDELVTYGIKGF